MRVLGLLVLFLLAACSPQATPTGESSPPLPPPPVPASPEAASPSGPLTEDAWKVWKGPVLAWRAAVLGLLTDESDPLGLADEERRTLLRTLMRRGVATEMVDFRVARLHAAAPEGWPDSEEPVPWDQAPEDLLLSALDALPASAPAAEPEPYPAALLERKQRLEGDTVDRLERSEDPPAWEESMPEGATRDLRQVAVALPDIMAPLQGEAAARAHAELRAMREPLVELQGAWEELTRLALATPERRQQVAARAETLAAGPVDLQQVNDAVAVWMEKTLRESRP